MSEIDKAIVTKYYIECELDNVVAGDGIRLKNDGYSSNLPRLLEALSFTYRLNGVYDYVESNGVTWTERQVPIDEVLLTGMGEHLTELIYSDEVGQNPRRLVRYAQDNPEDPRIAELAPREVPENRRTILLRQDSNDQLLLLDGSHRFLSMVALGETAVHAYVAAPLESKEKPGIGEATFLRLLTLWRQTDDPEFRAAIEQTTMGMVRETSNGYQAVQSYWVTMGQNDEVRATGRRILAESGHSDTTTD